VIGLEKDFPTRARWVFLRIATCACNTRACASDLNISSDIPAGRAPQSPATALRTLYGTPCGETARTRLAFRVFAAPLARKAAFRVPPDLIGGRERSQGIPGKSMMHQVNGRHCLAVRGGFRFIHRFLSESVAACLIAGMAIFAAVPEALAEPPIFRVDIKAAPAHESLYALAMQTGLTITWVTAGSAPPQTNAVSGSFSASDALDHMLVDTGLTYALVGRGQFEVRRAIGALHWYEIPPAPALDGLQAYANTVGWDALVDRALAQRARTAAVHGCFTPETAARKLLAGSPFTYEWISESDAGSPPVKALVLHPAALRQRIARLFDHDTMTAPDAIVAIDAIAAYCWRLCESEDRPLPPTCVIYSTPIP
jgi:hypothetical protein